MNRPVPEEPRGLPSRLVGRVVGSFVPPIVDHLDVDDVVERIDVDELVGRIDVDALLGRVDLNALLDRIDADRLLDRVDVNTLLDRIDPDRLLDRVDPDRLLDRVDVNGVLDRVDANALLDRVDPDRLLDRVDPDRLLDRVDPDRLIDRVDVNRMMARVDVNELVARTELDAVVARSTTGVFTRLLDVARVQLVTVDQVVQNVPARLLRRARREVPGRPGDETPPPDLTGCTRWGRAEALRGHYAGSVTRFLAFVVDQFLLGLLFALAALLVGTAFDVVVGRDVEAPRWFVSLAYVSWAFVYLAGQLAVSGQTVGKAILGLRVVGAGGGDLRPRQAALRTAVFPLSFVLLGAGLLLGLVRRDRRELHDLIAGTAVVYDWDTTAAGQRAAAPPGHAT